MPLSPAVRAWISAHPPTPDWKERGRAWIRWMAWHYYTGSELAPHDDAFDSTVASLRLIDDDPDSPVNQVGWGYRPGDPEPPRPDW